MECHPGCHACCIAISISSPIPGLPGGKPAGLRCPQLDRQGLCRIYNSPSRPAACAEFKPGREFCGENHTRALALLTELEKLTS